MRFTLAPWPQWPSTPGYKSLDNGSFFVHSCAFANNTGLDGRSVESLDRPYSFF
jgi:hypothetical protein